MNSEYEKRNKFRKQNILKYRMKSPNTRTLLQNYYLKYERNFYGMIFFHWFLKINKKSSVIIK